MTASAGLAGRLARLLGADPEVFGPLYRTQQLLLKRRARLVQSRRKGTRASSSTFGLLCFFAAMYGLLSMSLLFTGASRLLGAALAVTMNCAFLLLIVITDDFDVLVDRREALILGAHPHDGRSFLLAKLAAIGNSLAVLAAWLFVPPALGAAAAFRSAVAPLAFLAGAFAAGTATAAGGMLAAALLLRLGGRSALERLLPWLQGLFQLVYFFFFFALPRLLERARLSPAAEETLAWALPARWFLAPLELVSAGASPAAGLRLLLGLATLAALLAGATRLIAPGLRERLLEPLEETAGRRRRTAARRRAPRRGARGERRLLAYLLRVHLRADWRLRAEFLLTPFATLMFVLAISWSSERGGIGSMTLLMLLLGWLPLTSGEVLTRSSRPQVLWSILVAPVDRTRFSLATVELVRLFHLLPLAAAVAALQIHREGWGAESLARLAALLALGDLLVLAGKGLFPEFPFSRPLRSEGGAAGRRVVLMFTGGLVAGVAALLIYLMRLFGAPGSLAGLLLFLLLHPAIAPWVRRRVAREAEALEFSDLAAG